MTALHGVTIPGTLDEATHARVVLALRRRKMLLDASEPTSGMLLEAVRLTEAVHAMIGTCRECKAERELRLEAEAERDELYERLLAKHSRGNHGEPFVFVSRPDECPHGLGSLSGYTNLLCRCSGCSEANKTYKREYARRRRAKLRS